MLQHLENKIGGALKMPNKVFNFDDLKLLSVIKVNGNPCQVVKMARRGGKVLWVVAKSNNNKFYRITNKLAYN